MMWRATHSRILKQKVKKGSGCVQRGWARETDWRIVLFVMFSLWVCPVRELKKKMKLIIKGGLKKVLGLGFSWELNNRKIFEKAHLF